MEADRRHPVAPAGFGDIEVAHIVLDQGGHEVPIRLACGRERAELAGGLFTLLPIPRSLGQQDRIELWQQTGQPFVQENLVRQEWSAVARDEPASAERIGAFPRVGDAEDAGKDVRAVHCGSVDLGPAEGCAGDGLRESRKLDRHWDALRSQHREQTRGNREMSYFRRAHAKGTAGLLKMADQGGPQLPSPERIIEMSVDQPFWSARAIPGTAGKLVGVEREEGGLRQNSVTSHRSQGCQQQGGESEAPCVSRKV